MDMNPFADSDLRIARAHKNFNALRSEIVAWLERKTYSLSVEGDLNTGETVCAVDEVDPIPSQWGLDASEIIHHLRSALDNAIHQLSGGNVKGSEFPIFTDQEKFKKGGRK